ncbi:kynurenine--oxoglutarate transaminase-like [Dorcoceras hygrometricum]|nr:kynurenine--oxoglutarate transaminase-like [Dorcoceras hygrometricum]
MFELYFGSNSLLRAILEIFVISTLEVSAGSRFGDNVTVACCWYLARDANSYDDVSGATSFELVATLRFDAAIGISWEQCCALFLSCDWMFSCWQKRLRHLCDVVWLSYCDAVLICIRGLFLLLQLAAAEHCSSVNFSDKFPSFPVVVLLVRGSFGLRSRSFVDYYHSWGLWLARARSKSYCLGRVFAVIQLVEELTQLAVPQEVVECPSSV